MTNWRLRGACATGGYDPELFFSKAAGDRYDAKLVCRACPVRRTCLDAAMAEEAPAADDSGPFNNLTMRDGVRGGLTAVERWTIQYPEEAAERRERQAQRARDRLAALPPDERERVLAEKREASRARRRRPEIREGVKKRKAYKALTAAA